MSLPEITNEELTLVCTCGYINHITRFRYLKPMDLDEIVFVDVMLSNNESFWRRVWNAIKYVFVPNHGRYGNFCEILLDEKKMTELKDFSEGFLDDLANSRTIREGADQEALRMVSNENTCCRSNL